MKDKKFNLFILLSLFMIFTLVSCGNNHTHDFEDSYYKDLLNHWKECSCGEKGNVSEHSYGGWITIIEATENSVGSKKQTCGVCGYENIEEIPKLDHIHKFGDIYYGDLPCHWKECSCGEKGNVSEHSYGGWITIIEATENLVGSKKQTCSVCGYENIVETPKLDHVHNYTSEVIKPTCEDEGYTGYTCACGDVYIDSIVDALGHTIVKDKAILATCEENGLTEGSHCSVCNKILVAQEVVVSTGHDYDMANLVWSWNGYEVSKLTIYCKTDINHTKQFSANVTEEVTKNATCVETGIKTYTAVKNETLSAVGHEKVIDCAKAATCDQTGLTEGSHCSVCGEVFVAQEEIVALGHDYDMANLV